MADSSSQRYRSQLGLYDNNVTISKDRGVQFLPQRQRDAHSEFIVDVNSVAQTPNITDTIRGELDAACIYCPNGQFYLPRGEIPKILTPGRVLAAIQQLPCCSGLSSAEKKSLARDICLGGQGRCRESCLKVLAVAIQTGQGGVFLDMINAGITDDCLPLREVHNRTRHLLSCRHTDIKHEINISRWLSDSHTVSAWSYAVSAPYFTKPQAPDAHIHYELDDKDVFPFIEMDDSEPPEVSPVQKENATGSNWQKDIKEGGFGSVERVMIHPNHYDFFVDGLAGKNRPFALKRLFEPDPDKFNKELASLLSVQKDKGRHLIRLLTTFEVKTIARDATRQSIFYLLFPWADGDLWYFWKTHDAPQERLSRAVWMSEQCHAIANALMQVHNERDGHINRIKEIQASQHGLYGRHGDVKASNILWFKQDDYLVIADFGLGRLHSQISRSNQDPKALAATGTYRAPEFDITANKISRSCDIFSLGCTFLEFVTWYVLGWESLYTTFSDHRMEVDHFDIPSDAFFTIQNPRTPQETPVLKEKVISWIEQLRQNSNSSQYIQDFLDLIQRMLQPTPHGRIKTTKLVGQLHTLWKTCRTESDYIKAQSNSSQM